MSFLKIPRAAAITLAIIPALIGLMVGFLILMTFPKIGTPVTNWALSVWGPQEGASVSRAHTGFPGLTTLVFRDFQAADRAEVSTGLIRVNVFGFLPGVSWVSRAEAESGYITLARKTSDEENGFSLTALRRLVDEVSARNMEVRYTRSEEARVISVDTAEGSLRSGAFSMEASGGDTTLSFDGNAGSSTLASLEGQLRLTGENFADFAWLAGIASPDTPPYDALAHISIGADAWTIDFKQETRIGDSDVYGPLTIRLGGETPVIDAKLRSSNLDFDDLGIVFGIPIGVGGDEAVNEEQVQARRALDQSDRLIPNAVIDFTRLDAVNGTVTFEADQVSDAIFDIRGLKMEFEIDGRVVRAPVLELSFAQGQLSSYLTLDATQSLAMTTAEGTLQGVPFANLAAEPYVKGTVSGEYKLEARGNGFRQAAASLNGRVSVWSEDADLMALIVEAPALDILPTLAVLGEEEGEETYVPARCAAISLALQDGVARPDPALFDTEQRLVFITGDVNLQNETLDLSVQSDAKDPSFATLAVDVKLGGTFRAPELSALGAETVLQIGVAAALSSITGGLAALPFIEIGGAPDAPCADIISRAQTTRDQ